MPACNKMLRQFYLCCVFIPVSLHAAEAKTIRIPAEFPSIQAGINAADSGDTVLVSAGIYREHVVCAKGVVVRIVGDNTPGKMGLQRAEETVIVGSGENATSAAVTMAEGSVLDGFSVTGIGTFDEEKWNHHHKTQGNHQEHEHIGAPGVAGIDVNRVNCSVLNNIVHHIGYTGIAVRGAVDSMCQPVVRRNVCFRNMGAGIGSMQHSAALIEENQCFQNFYAGIGHNNASPVVRNNQCFENTRAGIGISAGACPVVRGNKCFRNRRAGIGSRTGRDTSPLIEGNDCYENDMAGIGAEEEAAPVIRENRCYRNKLAGIGSRDHAHSLIIGNECFENDQAGIGQESGAVTTLINNYCHHNKTAGIGFAACESGSSRVIGNRLIDNSLVAAGVHSGWKVDFLDNEFVRQTGMAPILMVFEGADVTLNENLIRGGGVAGVRVAGRVRMAGNKIEGTKMRPVGPPNFAVWALEGAQVTMVDNRIHNWRHALHATSASIVATTNSIGNFQRTAFVAVDPRGGADHYGQPDLHF